MGTARKIHPDKRREKPFLEQTGGAGRGRTFELSRDILSIGRTEDNEIVMKSESVSRCHAYFKKSAAGIWLVQDNNSKNGIRVNGKKVTESALKEGDLIVAGDFSFRFFEAARTEKSEITRSHRIPVASPAALPKRASRVSRGVGQKVFKTSSWDGFLDFAERYSWIVGIVAGVCIGGGVWLKASRVAPRPGAATALRAPALKATTPIESPEKPSAPATFASETTASQTVSKSDLAVSHTPSKKPKNDIRDLKVYLREGRDYLKEGDKESAIVAFRFALVLDPANKEALKGLRSAGVKSDPPAKAPAPVVVKEPKPNPEARNRSKVTTLLKGAVEAFNRRSYQEAIDKAESARKIEIPGSTEYINEAKQIIDRARIRQKEDFEPFVEAALKKIHEKDFQASAGLCEEMLRMDPAYGPAKDCLARSLDGMAGKGMK